MTPWTVAQQTPLSMGIFRQEYWSGLPFPSPGDLPHPGIEPVSPISQGISGRFFFFFLTTGASLEAQLVMNPPAMQETPVPFLGQEGPLEKRWATHSSILRLPWGLR